MSRIYLEVAHSNRTIIARDLEERDLESILNYWFNENPEFYQSMGVDANRMPPRTQRREFFKNMIGADPKHASSFMMIAECDGKTVAYTLFNHIMPGESCQVHIHVLDPEFRKQGFSSEFFAKGFPIIPDLLNVRKIILEPNANHLPVNRMIQRFGLKPVRTYHKPAQGICMAMEVNRYELSSTLIKFVLPLAIPVLRIAQRRRQKPLYLRPKTSSLPKSF